MQVEQTDSLSTTSMNLGSPERAPPLSPGVPDPGGVPLDLLLKGAMEMGEFLRLAISIAAALGHVHGRGLVHKDIKPANILVNPAHDQAWLMGLGVASLLPRERTSPQHSQFPVGTLAYMAPEQTGRMNRSIDARSDLYGLGVTFYEMLTGAVPFTALDPMELMHSHIARQPTPPREKVNGVPRAVSAIIMKLLAKTAEERYQTAAGVESDLQRCLAQWETQRRIEDFPLGEQDTPDRLLIPEKLYGRESAIDALLAAFDRVVAGGGPELVLVSGYSGIGKSSVVNEIHPSLVASGGLFASGKFDQHQRDVPYSTLAQAFQSLIRLLLGKSDSELSRWRDSLRDALGPNARLIVNLVPELQLIVGEPAPIPELSPQDAQRRFQFVMRRFIGVFARSEHPLCLFLDDLQWLDSATLELIEDLLTQSEVRHLMLVGAYRENEVNASHPLTRKLETVRKAGTSVRDIVLAPLTRADLVQWVTDALHRGPEDCTALADLIQEKTAGNPFFALQFVSALAEERLLTFDYGERQWTWDLSRIRAKGYSDNVVDLMVSKLNRLPAETQQALELLACIGNCADFALVAMVSQQSSEECRRQLWEAIRAGLILVTEDSYKFLHDRVQEAAYSLIPEESRAAVHLRIGRLLATHTPADKCEERIFDIVNQLNRAPHLITSGEERRRLAELNFIAGRRAKSSTAYTSALAYLSAARAMLIDESWDAGYDLIFSIECDIAECELLTADMAAAEKRLSMLAQRARRAHDRVLVTRLRVTLYVTLDRGDSAVEVCLEYLRSRGTDWSQHPTWDEVAWEFDRMWTQLGKRRIEQLIDLPLMIDPEVLDDMDVLGDFIVPALYCDRNLYPLIVGRMVNLSLEHGNADGSCVAYVAMGMIITAFGHYAPGSRFGRLAHDLTEQRGLRGGRARTYMTYGSIVMPWTQHVRAGQDLIRRIFDAAQEVGDLTFAAYGYAHLVSNLLAAGDPLAEAQHEAEAGIAFVRKARFGMVIDDIATQLAFIRTLRGSTTRFGWLDDGDVDELRLEQRWSDVPTLAMTACRYWIRKLQARYLAGHYAAALDAASKAQPLLWTIPARFELADMSFFEALAHAASWDGASAEAKQSHFAGLKAQRDQLETWAQSCPENFANRAALLTAEIARIEGREFEAMRAYEQAISSARSNGFVHNEALACETAARFYAARGFEAFADLYFRRARHCYQQWGAQGKVRQLVELYPRLSENEPAPDSRDTRGAPVEQLELATVLKVSQAVSGEMNLDRLLDRLMRAAIEHAGAERGLLIARRGDELQIQAQATASGADVTVNLRDSDHAEAALPQSLVRYVARTRETVTLEDASSQNLFSADPYFVQHRARSILCLPLIHQGNLIAVLYLENNLAPRVFEPARITVLKLLASQAAMSLENARVEQALRHSETYLAEAQRLTHTGSWAFSLVTGKHTYYSDEAFRLFGLDPRRGRPPELEEITRLIHPEERDRVLEELAQVLRDEAEYEQDYRIVLPDGTVRHMHSIGHPVRDPSGGGVEYFGTVIDVTERRRAERALRQSEAYLAEAQRLTHTGSWAFNPFTGTVPYWSDEMFRIYGMGARRDPPTYDEMAQLTHPEDRVRNSEAIRIAIRDKAGIVLDYRHVRADGTIRHLHSVGHPVLDRTGAVVEYFGTLVDVTERRRAEQRLLTQHRVARILAEAVTMEEAAPKILQAVGECMGWDVGMRWRIDREADALRCAEVWRKSSIAPFEVPARTSTFRLGSGLPGRVWESRKPEQVPDVADDPESYTDNAARAGLRAAFALPILLDCEVVGVIGFFSRDVWQPDQDLLDMMATLGSQIGQFTKRAAAVDEAQLRVSMLHHIPVAAWSLKPDGTPDIVNQLWFEYTGQTPEYVYAHPDAWLGIVHPEDRERASRIQLDGIRSGQGFTLEARFLRARDGAYRWHLNRAVAVRDAEGSLLRFVGTSTDVHDWRQAQEDLRNTQAELAHTTRVLTMGELTASIAHEVNQPLGAIVASAAAGERWLSAEPPQMEKARRALERIINDGRRAGEVIKRIRALMKRQAPQKDWLGLNEAIVDVIAIAQHQLQRNDIVLDTQLAEGLPLVRGDKVQLQQVLLNLIVNAIEAMGGIDERRELTIVSATDGPEAVAVEVRDSGMGLDPERATRLFEPFYTTKSEGIGIGLSISRSIVEAHGGHLSAAANVPHGAVFRFSLPVDEPVS